MTNRGIQLQTRVTNYVQTKLTVKVYLNPDTDRQEIRRLVFDKGQLAINYSILEEHIKRVFPLLHTTRFQLSWKGEFNIICLVTRLKSIEFHARTRSNAFKKSKLASFLTFKTSQLQHNSQDCYTSRFL